MNFVIGKNRGNVKFPVKVGIDEDLFVIAGPCVIESRKICLEIAERLVKVSKITNTGIIFKASFDKANRSSIKSFRGPGIEKGLDILAEVKEKTKLAVLTDVHLPEQASKVADVVDCLQIPAFLCRQTDLICACAETNLPVNVKKGQFVSPGEMKNVVAKLKSCGNEKITLTERGTFFGYGRLVNDMTAIEQMKQLGCPVVFDATHSTQQPGGLGNASGGQPDMTPLLAKAAVAAGANGLFFEVHPEPKKAKSDASCMIGFGELENVISTCKKIFEIVHHSQKG
jgi:2-dehydro-3-deoxyphosphooctonate aldolase (KDO 8-P synthase)